MILLGQKSIYQRLKRAIDRVSDDITMPIVWFVADRSKICPFKSMVKFLHTRDFKQTL